MYSLSSIPWVVNFPLTKPTNMDSANPDSSNSKSRSIPQIIAIILVGWKRVPPKKVIIPYALSTINTNKVSQLSHNTQLERGNTKGRWSRRGVIKFFNYATIPINAQ